MGVSPTLIRALRVHGDEPVLAHDRSSLRVLGSTGEPWNPDPWQWLFSVVGGGRLPIVNYSGGTEVSGGIVGCNLLRPIRSTSFNGPCIGMAADVVDAAGASGPGLGRRAGDPPAVAGDDPRLLGRARRRALPRDLLAPDSRACGSTATSRRPTPTATGTSTAAPTTPSRWPASASARPRSRPAPSPTRRSWPRPRSGCRIELKGEAIVVLCVPRPGDAWDPAIALEVSQRVVHELGKPVRPKACVVVGDLPRTRSGKVMRRVARAAYLGLDPGDLSALENPASLEAIRGRGEQRRYPALMEAATRTPFLAAIGARLPGLRLLTDPSTSSRTGATRRPTSSRAAARRGPADRRRPRSPTSSGWPPSTESRSCPRAPAAACPAARSRSPAA